MPVCRHCKSRISKFDKDRCPVCGELNPLEGVNSDTIEITTEVHLNESDYANYKPKKRIIVLILSILLGWTGATMFYLGSPKRGLLWILIHALVGAGLYFALYFITSGVLVPILSVVGVFYVINIIIGVMLYKNPNLKDAKNNLLR